MRFVLVAGGRILDEFALLVLKELRPDRVIAVDSGMDFLARNQLSADLMIGDFDSISEEVLKEHGEKTERMSFPGTKDESDLGLAIMEAIKRGATEIYILGGLGGRFDHSVANVQAMTYALRRDIPCFLLDEKNRIRLINKRTSIKKKDQYGKYVSILAFTSEVTGVSLKGFYYPVENAIFTVNYPLGVSNQIIDEKAVIELKSGVLLLIESS